MATKKVSVEQSNSGSLNNTDYKKIAKGAGIAFGAAFLYSVLSWLMTWLSAGTVDWSNFIQPFMTTCIPAALAVGINAVMKLMAGPQ